MEVSAAYLRLEDLVAMSLAQTFAFVKSCLLRGMFHASAACAFSEMSLACHVASPF
jgi:hypothetical protein